MNPIAFLNKYLQVPIISGESGFVAPPLVLKHFDASKKRKGQFKDFNSLLNSDNVQQQF